ncbi:TetR/AcrR family transcriptional regulator [Agromyces bracchium]|uniref:TetR family transcriptional regulator n=1 Tax=Agromyces bracchium TaxID=88376 RepID=A0A6I3M5B2_9MICO|nr:TetR/AcrR family transcriptional regulator [Agromyces bracchium]MTH67327.1 TetR family transcriptional regulator [Agromyces bracchium]
MAASSRRGSYSTGRDRRERILDAAAASFARGDFDRTPTVELARQAGVTAPGLAHHFPTREHLLLALAERRFETAAATAEASPPDTDGTATLRLMLRQTEARVAEPELIRLFVRIAGVASDPGSAAHALYAARYERVVDDIAQRFERSAAAGHLRDDVDYRAVAREFIAVSDGLQIQWVLSNGDLDLVDLIRRYLERLAPEILANGAAVAL